MGVVDIGGIRNGMPGSPMASKAMPTQDDIFSFDRVVCQDVGGKGNIDHFGSIYDTFMDWFNKGRQISRGQPESISSMYDQYMNWHQNISQAGREQPENTEVAQDFGGVFLTYNLFCRLHNNSIIADQGDSAYSASSSSSGNVSDPVNTSTTPETKTAETVEAAAEATEEAAAPVKKAQAPEETNSNEKIDKADGNGNGLKLKTYGINQNFTELTSDAQSDDQAQDTGDPYATVDGLTNYGIGGNTTDDAAKAAQASAGATAQTEG